MQTKVQFRPGIQRDLTPLSGEGTFYDCEKVRFRDGLAENIGGWRKPIASLVVGLPRKLHAWTNNQGTRLAAIGTSKRLYIYDGVLLHNITPLKSSGTLGSNPFSVTSGSAVVTVKDTNHDNAVGDYVIFSGASAVGGIAIDGEYTVTTIIDSNTYTVTHGSNATSTATGGGASVAYEYEISIGYDEATYLYGYGAGTYGQETWGTPRSANAVVQSLRYWSADNWGEDLLAMPRGGSLYHWDATNGVTTRATKVTNAPTGEVMLVDPESRHVIVFGEDGDPVGIKWCDQNDFTNWTASATTTADERRLLKGAKIVSAIRTKGEILIWTDASLHGMQYTNRGDFAYALRTIGEQCGLLAPNAAAAQGDVAYWMGQRNFYLYDGRVRVLPSPLRKEVFDNLETTQLDKIAAGTNSQHNEIWWFWQSTAGSENDRFTIYNYGERIWYHGNLERTAWADKTVWDYPMAMDSVGQLRDHEFGYNDDGNAMTTWVETGDFDIADGDDIMLMGGIIPDFVQSGTVTLTLKARKYPNTEQISKGPYNVTASDDYIKARIRGRQVAVRVGSAEVDAMWRMGVLRYDARPDGKN